MTIKLIKATYEDCGLIHEMQVKAFKEHLLKYHDYDTNPGNEALSKTQKRFNNSETTYYLISTGKEVVGAVRIVDNKAEQSYRISPIFILPEAQGNRYAKETMLTLETLYTEHTLWQLSTILEEDQLCQFYEGLGYVKSGKSFLQEGMHLVYYNKQK